MSGQGAPLADLDHCRRIQKSCAWRPARPRPRAEFGRPWYCLRHVGPPTTRHRPTDCATLGAGVRRLNNRASAANAPCHFAASRVGEMRHRNSRSRRSRGAADEVRSRQCRLAIPNIGPGYSYLPPLARLERREVWCPEPLARRGPAEDGGRGHPSQPAKTSSARRRDPKLPTCVDCPRTTTRSP